MMRITTIIFLAVFIAACTEEAPNAADAASGLSADQLEKMKEADKRSAKGTLNYNW